MRKLKIVTALVAAFGAGSVATSDAALAAYGFCSAPIAPTAFLSKPSKPYCLTARNCSSWQLNSYKSDVDRYYESLERYAKQVDDYYTDASKYVKCMSYLD